ncbi:hypothetical protein [Paractinoplanes rishiriensis]|uniref:Uncharacterized protein n=1 Tax=Paractinoplanes rishiriensis TaxID=1050105 RepID=A0A919MNS9_9ACTN|nr:hypothetical protein [Actinoplanes rishiriensis]GIE94356.1 hypothetical protein Ari01nite_18210 [Actinoplanes rishiriensis]
MGAEPVVEWPIPPAEGYFAEDLDRIPGLPSRTELIDGTLVHESPQKLFHERVKLSLPFAIDIDLTAIDRM